MATRARITDDEALSYHLEPSPGKIEINASTAMATQRDLSYTRRLGCCRRDGGHGSSKSL